MLNDTKRNSEVCDTASWVLVAVAWALVGIPLGWGIWVTFQNAARLFH